MYKQMIYDLLKLLEDNHLDCYFNISKEDTLKYIDRLLSENKLNDEYDFYYLANKLIKKMFGVYDSHTKLIFKECDNLPIRLKYIDNKVYITRTDENNKDLLYGEVLKINDIPVSKLISEVIDMTAYSTNDFLRMPIEVSLRTIEKLKSLPSINNNSNEFNYEVKLNNQIINRTLKKQIEDLLPINKWKKNYSMDVLGDTIYIVYNACKEDYSGQMKEFVEKLKDCSTSNSINKFIVDLRGNAGGNSDIFDELVEFLNGKEIITLVDEYVFSGGRWALVELNNIGSKFVGTGIGTALNCFGNVSRFEIGHFILPIANKYFYYDNNKLGTIKDKSVLNEIKNSNKELFEPIIFRPDYYVENTIENLKNEYDRQLHSAQMLINKTVDNDRKQEFSKLETSDDLMKFLDNNITYGWIDKFDQKYVNTLDHLRENYKTNSLKEIFESGLATCIEDAKLIKLFFDKMNIESKLYCCRAYENDDNFDEPIKMHCFVLFKSDDYWYHFEHSMNPIKGIKKYESIENALDSIKSLWNKNERQLAEIDDIPDGLSFKEFNQYVNQFDNKYLKR